VSVRWTVETLGPAVDRELEVLPADMRARFVRVAGLIEEFGPDGVRAPHVGHLTGRLWEMRMKGRAGISRALYVVGRGRKVVVVRVFVKKTQKTPPREIDIALKRAKEVPR
jgi:phage-related protein